MTTQKSQVALNAITGVAVLAMQAGVGLLLTPFLVSRLGIDVYGLVPLAMSVGAYVSVATAGIQSAVARNLTVAIATEDSREASRILSTALWSTLGLCALAAGPLMWVALSAPQLFDVPESAAGAARLFFAAVVFSYLLVAVREVVGSVAFAHNRLDLQNAGRATDAFLRLVVPLVLVGALSSTVVWVGAGMAVGAVASLTLIFIAWRRLAPRITASPRLFSRGLFSELSATSWWISLGQAGSLLHLSIDVAVVNIMVGASAAGQYGTVAQWPTFLRSLAGALIAVLTPLLYRHFAADQYSRLSEVSRRAVRLVAVCSGFAVAVVAGFGRPLLSLWLGPEYAVLAPLLFVSMIHLSINLAMVPLFAVHTALGKVKLPALVTLATGLLNLVLSIIWAKTGAYAIGVAVATLVALTAKNALFTPIYTARILNLPTLTFIRPALPGVSASLALTGACLALSHLVALDTWASLAVAIIGVGVPFAIVAWHALLVPADRALVMSVLGRRA